MATITGPEPSPHYTAIIEVVHTSPPRLVHKDSYDKVGSMTPRINRDISRIVVRAKTIDALIEKAQNHLTLLEDD